MRPALVRQVPRRLAAALALACLSSLAGADGLDASSLLHSGLCVGLLAFHCARRLRHVERRPARR
jgi:hypothetical protein